MYVPDTDGRRSGDIGHSPDLHIRVPNTVGQFSIVRFSTATGDGSLAGLASEVVTNGPNPNSSGRAHFWVQNGSVTQSVAIFSKFGLLLPGGGGGGMGFPAGLTLNVPNAAGQYNGLRYST